MLKKLLIAGIMVVSLLLVSGCQSATLPEEGRNAIDESIEGNLSRYGISADGRSIESVQRADLSDAGGLPNTIRLADETWCVVISPPASYTTLLNFEDVQHNLANFIVSREGSRWHATTNIARHASMLTYFERLGCTNYSPEYECEAGSSQFFCDE